MKLSGVIGLVLVFLLVGCSKMKLKGNEIFRDGDFRIQMVGVEDSRCPNGANCFWEGNAAVHLKLTNQSQEEFIVLNTFDNMLRDTALMGYEIKLGKVKPYPSLDETISFSDYKIILKVKKQ